MKTAIQRLLPRAPRDDQPAFGPASIEVGAHVLRLPYEVCTSIAIAGYPREVGAGWLEPLLTYPGRLDVSMHIEPIPPVVAAAQLRRRMARLESSSRSDAEHGRLTDFTTETAATDAAELAATLARGYGKLFRVGLYLTVHADTEDRLDAEVQQVRAMAAGMLLDAQPATFRQLQGWVTAALPLASDALKLRRSFDTGALAAAFPFASPDLNAPTGDCPVLYGTNIYSTGVVVWDRFAQDNYNSVVLARSGAGKSYFTKLEALRLLYHGVQVAVVDPEGEYQRLAEAVGGTHIALGSDGVRFNPFDLPVDQHGDVLTRRALFIQTLVATMLGETLDPLSRAALDRAVRAAYGCKGITDDRRNWVRPAPLLTDVAAALIKDRDNQKAAELAARLEPFITGSYRSLFAGATTTHPTGHLLVFGLRDLPEELKAVGILLALDAIWRRVANPAEHNRHLVVIDEGWLLMKEPEGAKFLYRLAKSARRHWCGLSVVTQDAADLLGSDLGKAVVTNSAAQILLRQSPQAIDTVADAFALSAGERAFLLSADKGEGLLVAGAAGDRVAYHAASSDSEHSLITTDPADLADQTDPL